MATRWPTRLRIRKSISAASRRPSCTLPPPRSTPWFRSALQDQPPKSGGLSGADHRIHHRAGSSRVAGGIFDERQRGGQGAILNQDGSVNSHSNPAAPGSVVCSLRHRRRAHHARQCGWSSHFQPPALPDADASGFGYHQRSARPGSLCGSRAGFGCRSVADQCGGARRRVAAHLTIRSSSRSAIMPAPAP